MPDRLVRSSNVLWRRTLRGALLRRVGGATVLLDGSGSIVWSALATPRSLDEISEWLATQTGEDPAVIATDMRPVLDQLVRLGVVVPAP